MTTPMLRILNRPFPVIPLIPPIGGDAKPSRDIELVLESQQELLYFVGHARPSADPESEDLVSNSAGCRLTGLPTINLVMKYIFNGIARTTPSLSAPLLSFCAVLGHLEDPLKTIVFRPGGL